MWKGPRGRDRGAGGEVLPVLQAGVGKEGPYFFQALLLKGESLGLWAAFAPSLPYFVNKFVLVCPRGSGCLQHR